MSESTDLERALDRFFDRTAAVLSEYDRGYADADATVRVLRTEIEELRDARTGPQSTRDRDNTE
jgi:hypothetical protein